MLPLQAKLNRPFMEIQKQISYLIYETFNKGTKTTKETIEKNEKELMNIKGK